MRLAEFVLGHVEAHDAKLLHSTLKIYSDEFNQTDPAERDAFKELLVIIYQRVYGLDPELESVLA